MIKNILNFLLKNLPYILGILMISGIIYLIIRHYINKTKTKQNIEPVKKLSCVETDCFPYKCQNDKCLNKCITNSDCVYGYNCVNSSCVEPKHDSEKDNDTRIPDDQIWEI
jgi:hypothetical protein